MDSVNACASCWRKTTHEMPCGPLNEAGVCPDCAAAIAQGKDIEYMTFARLMYRSHHSRKNNLRSRSTNQ
jgi:hypothetical protein